MNLKDLGLNPTDASSNPCPSSTRQILPWRWLLSTAMAAALFQTGGLTAAVNDLWITEVLPSTGEVEVTNVGADPETWSTDLPFCHRFNYSSSIPSGTSFAPGESKVFTVSGLAADDSDLWLYRDSSFSNPSSLIGGLKWGPAVNVGRMSEATTAGRWTGTSDTVMAPAPGESLQLTGANPFAPAHWSSGSPNLGRYESAGAEVRLVTVSIILQNLAPDPGTYLTPIWIGFHDGTFDLFDSSAEASDALERLAEDGNAAPLMDLFTATPAGSHQDLILSGGDIPPFAPGASRTLAVTLDANDPRSRFLSFASMVIPSNDAFIGNDDPTAYPIFDDQGNFIGADIVRLGSQVYDAGTEVNDELPMNTAFFGQMSPNTGVDENGTVQPHPGFMPAGQGGILDDPMFTGADFTAAGYQVAGLSLDLALLITRIHATGDQVDVEWLGGAPPFQVQWRQQVDSGAWMDLADPTEGSSLTVQVPEATAFFRVVSSPVVAPATAQYEVTFDAVWSAATHPTDFPGNPHFSGLIGATHNAQVEFWAPGTMASPGIQSMAETGSKSPLNDEVQSAIDVGTAEFLLSGGGVGTSPGVVTLNVDVSQNYPLVTLVSMIAPSPDWFVGVHGVSLFNNGNWVEEQVVDLFPYDAGTDDGMTYTSSNAVSDPQGVIAPIEEAPLEVDGGVPPLGTLTFRRLQ